MNILSLINTLKTFAKGNSDLDVGICLNVSEQGVLVNRNFIFHTVEGRVLVLISPSEYEQAQILMNEHLVG